jgi:ribonuclease T2
VRKAHAVVKIPLDHLTLDKLITVTPDDGAEAFVKTNLGLTPDRVVAACDSTRIEEVRICFGKDFSVRDCAGVTRHTCQRESIAMPAVRGE